MSKLWAVCYYTFRESLARKTFVAFFVISSLTLLLFLFALNIDAVDGAVSAISIFGQQAQGVRLDVKELIVGLESGIAVTLFTLGIFFSIFATANLIPTMLEKGNIDWIIAKPISREILLVGRYLGALAIVAFNVFYLIGGSWVILSLKTGYWNGSFLIAGCLITILFAILYAVMMFLSVLLQNSAISIMGAYLIIFISAPLFQRDNIYALLSKKTYQVLLDGIYYIMPRVVEIGNVVREVVLGHAIDSWAPVWHSILIGIFYFSFALILFKRKNY
jgi:ABC-type transport system involved in multi-copper enzyme maturation permease subunit